MRGEYILELTVVPKSEQDDYKKFSGYIVDKAGADTELISSKQSENAIKIEFRLSAGAPITDFNSMFGWIFRDDFKAFDCKIVADLTIDTPDYLAYLAKKRFRGEEPLSWDDFYKKIKEGTFWRDI